MEELEQEQQQLEQTPEVPQDESALNQPETDAVPETQQEQPSEDVETLKKRLADTQRWAHQLNQEKQQREQAERLRQLQDGVQPDVLSAVDQAIEVREIRARQEQQRKNEDVLRAIHEVEPEIDTLNQNPAFAKALDEQARKLLESGKDPLNPIFAVKAVVEARKQFEMSQARAAAEAEDKARKASKMAAMNVPASGTAAPPRGGKSPEEDAAAVWNMSAEDFAKLKQKARGF
jgi:hypothetical protein